MPALTGAKSSSETVTGACFARPRALEDMPLVNRKAGRGTRSAPKCVREHAGGPTVRRVTDGALAAFLLPAGFAKPSARAVLQEASLVTEAGRYALATRQARRARKATPYSGRRVVRSADPVIL